MSTMRWQPFSELISLRQAMEKLFEDNGETKEEEKVKREDYFYREHRYGTLSRSVTLSSGLNTDKTEQALITVSQP